MIWGTWGMSEVLKGLYARRANLERRIAAAAEHVPGACELAAENTACENAADLQLKLRCVVKQIDAYVDSGSRWDHSAEARHPL